MTEAKTRRSLIARIGFTALGGSLYASLLIQPTCVKETQNSGADAAPLADAMSLADAAATADASPATPDSSTPVDSAVTVSTCWTQAVASYTGAVDGPGCGIPSTVLAVNGGQIVLTPFGANSTASFTPGQTTPNAAVTSGLTIFDAGSHTCTVTCVPGATPAATTITLACTNPQGGACTETFTR